MRDVPDPARLVSCRTTVAAPPDVVFAVVADPRQHPRIDGSRSATGWWSSSRTAASPGGTSAGTAGATSPSRRSTVDGGTVVTETFDYTRNDPFTAAVLRLAGLPERNRAGITETLVRLKRAAEPDHEAAVRRAPG